jgi:enoyl-CoA hydratase/carnithine racemase
MNFNSIDFSISNNIARITLNRPDAGNTLNIEIARELYKATNIVSTNNNIKVLILTGKGKLFCV